MTLSKVIAFLRNKLLKMFSPAAVKENYCPETLSVTRLMQRFLCKSEARTTDLSCDWLVCENRPVIG